MTAPNSKSNPLLLDMVGCCSFQSQYNISEPHWFAHSCIIYIRVSQKFCNILAMWDTVQQLQKLFPKSWSWQMLYSRDEWRTIIKEWWDHNTFLYKNISLSLLLKRSETGRKCERDKDDGHRLVEDCYIDLFLTTLWILYSEPYIFASLMGDSHPGSTGCHLAHPSEHSPAALWIQLPSVCLIDHDWPFYP